MKTFFQFSKLLCLILFTVLLSASCNNDDDASETIDCSVDVAECLTDGDSQVYFMFSSDGSQVTNSCFMSIQIGFDIDGTFTWNSNSGSDANCLDLIGFEDFTGNWTLENNNTEIHITPPWFTNQGQTKTVLDILSLSETDMEAITPSQAGEFTIIWRRL